MHPARTRADRPATPTLTTVRGAEEQGRNGVLLDAYPGTPAPMPIITTLVGDHR